MANDVLISLLKDYEQKKLRAELDLEKRKLELYKRIPDLQRIEDDLNGFAILTAKNVLLHNQNSLDDLNRMIEDLKYKKACILQNAGFSSDYLTPNYECSFCNDTGYVSNGNDGSVMCSCLKQRLLDVSFNRSNMSNLNRENFGTFNECLFSDVVDVAKYRFNVSPRQNIVNIRQKCLDFVENFDDFNTKNLLFSGNTGLR